MDRQERQSENKSKRKMCIEGNEKRGRETGNWVNNSCPVPLNILNHRLQRKLFIYDLLVLLFRMLISWLFSVHSYLSQERGCIYLKQAWLILGGCLRGSALVGKSHVVTHWQWRPELGGGGKALPANRILPPHAPHATVLLAVGCALLRLAVSDFALGVPDSKNVNDCKNQMPTWALYAGK